ncbi:MAG: hypothetical protein CMH52_01960 [Myxococcales bacterium]|nr:hypothetical protein [Myxococcales bacterium]
MAQVDAAMTASLSNELLARGQAVQFVARGQSMWPFIMDGDTVHVEPLIHPPRIGDVVLLERTETGPLHRVVAGPRQGRFLIWGDALPRPDAWVRADEIVGRLAQRQRDGVEKVVYSGLTTVLIARSLGASRRFISKIRHGFLGSR